MTRLRCILARFERASARGARWVVRPPTWRDGIVRAATAAPLGLTAAFGPPVDGLVLFGLLVVGVPIAAMYVGQVWIERAEAVSPHSV